MAGFALSVFLGGLRRGWCLVTMARRFVIWPGLGASDARAVHDLLPAALGELGIPVPDSGVAAALVIFDDLARRLLAGELGERCVARQVEEIVVRAGYSCRDSRSAAGPPLRYR